MKYLYEAQRMDNGEFITGGLIHSPHSPFAYIATIENMENMIIDELNEGTVSNLKLIRVMKKSIRLVDKLDKEPVKFSDNTLPLCPVCGSGEYMLNEDGNKNDYCGQCGTHFDWDNMKNVDTE